MNYNELLRKRDLLNSMIHRIPKDVFLNYQKSFEIEYAHNSTAIEGNTLTLVQTKAILEDNLSVGGKSLRELYEVVNHGKAFTYISKCVRQKKPLSEDIVKDIHSILMENILSGGIYRNVNVRITGAKHKPPVPTEMYYQIKNFFAELPYKQNLNAIELAAYTHGEFVKIHPFPDGNGRASRLIMNYQLMSDRFLPISIAKENRLEYFEALEAYAVNSDLTDFIEIIAKLEEERLDEYLGIIK